MNKTQNLLSIIIASFILLLMVSCGGVNADAKKAASLTNKSIEKTNRMKLKEAEKLHQKSQAIIRKYESHKKSEKFYKLYEKHRDKGKIAHQEQKEQ